MNGGFQSIQGKDPLSQVHACRCDLSEELCYTIALWLIGKFTRFTELLKRSGFDPGMCIQGPVTIAGPFQGVTLAHPLGLSSPVV